MGKGIITLLAALVLGLVTPVTAGSDPSLMGWWKFEGNGLDSSGSGHNGSLKKDAHYEAGQSGQALALDGDGDCFTVEELYRRLKGLLS